MSGGRVNDTGQRSSEDQRGCQKRWEVGGETWKGGVTACNVQARVSTDGLTSRVSGRGEFSNFLRKA